METDTIQIPRKIVEEIYDTHEKINQILETLEVLMDAETLKRLKQKDSLIEIIEKPAHIDRERRSMNLKEIEEEMWTK